MSNNSDYPQVTIIVDGACSGNPGPGGWAAILRFGDHEKVLTGHEAHTTNNRMELTAVIKGLQALKFECDVTIVTDSSYVALALNGGKMKANPDLIGALHHQAARHHRVTMFVVAGHSGHVDNERADALARAAIVR